MGTTWTEFAAFLDELMLGLAPRHFVVVNYLAELTANPYVQVAREDDGTWYCEVASHYNVDRAWPTCNEIALHRAGWAPPESPGENWSQTVKSGEVAVGLLVQALRECLACPDPSRIVCRLGFWPKPPNEWHDEAQPSERPFAIAA